MLLMLTFLFTCEILLFIKKETRPIITVLNKNVRLNICYYQDTHLNTDTFLNEIRLSQLNDFILVHQTP